MRINFLTTYINRFQKIPIKKNVSNPFCINQNNVDTFFRTTDISFGMHCSENAFEIKNIRNMRCPACGLIMLQEDQIEAFVDDISRKKGEALVKALEKYENESIFVENSQESKERTIYRPHKQRVVDKIKELALKYPELSLEELVRLRAKECIDDLIKRQLVVVNELERKINSYTKKQLITKQEFKELEETIDEYTKQIKGDSEEIFQRKKFIAAVIGIIQNKKTRQKIEAILLKLPSSENELDSFFVKYGKKDITSSDIALKLVQQSKASADHMVPKKETKDGTNEFQGGDKFENYLCTCMECNSRRGHEKFHDWQKKIPNFEENLQEYIERIKYEASLGNLSFQYGTYYISSFIDKIKELTHGEIKLKQPAIRILADDVIQEEEEKEQIYKFISQLQDKKEELKKLRALQRELSTDETYKKFKRFPLVERELASLNSEYKSLRREEARKRSEIERYKKKQLELQEKQGLLSAAQEEDKSQREELKKLRKFLNKTTLEELEEELAQIQTKIKNLITKKVALTEEYKSLQATVLTSNAIQAKINEIQSKMRQISELKTSIYRLETKIATLPDIEEQIEALNKEVSDLQEENNALSSSKSTKGKVEYDDLNQILRQINKFLSFHMSPQNTEYSTEKRIYQFAKQKVEEQINHLASGNPYVKMQLNNIRIDEINEQLKDLEQKRKEIFLAQNQAEKQRAQLSLFDNNTDLTSELDKLYKEQNRARLYYNNSEIDNVISYLQINIEEREYILRQYNQGVITRSEALDMISRL